MFHISTVIQLQSVTYRELTYRTKSIAVKAVSMVIPFHPNMTMWNFHILLFVSNGSKQNWKNMIILKIFKTRKQTNNAPKNPENKTNKKKDQNKKPQKNKPRKKPTMFC